MTVMVREKSAEFVNEVNMETLSCYKFRRKEKNKRKDKNQDKYVLQMLETYATRLLY